jgi:hypothetical protein
MSTLGYETPELDELRNLADAEWRRTLEDALGSTLFLDADEADAPHYAEPTSFVLPYRAAMQRYSNHVHHCKVCTEQSFTEDNCDEGHNLAHLAADAMAMQEEKAALN